MTPPRLPRNWQWGLDRTGDILAVNLYSPSFMVTVYRVIVAHPVRTWILLRLYILLGFWTVIAGRRISNWLYRVTRYWEADKREERRLELAEALNGDWDYRGNRIEGTP